MRPPRGETHNNSKYQDTAHKSIRADNKALCPFEFTCFTQTAGIQHRSVQHSEKHWPRLFDFIALLLRQCEVESHFLLQSRTSWHCNTTSTAQCTQYIRYMAGHVHSWQPVMYTSVMHTAGRVHGWSCTHPVMYTADRVYNWSCTQPVMYTADRVYNWSCTRLVMYTTGHVHGRSCIQLVMYTAGHVYNWSCIQLVMYTAGHASCSQQPLLLMTKIWSISGECFVVYASRHIKQSNWDLQQVTDNRDCNNNFTPTLCSSLLCMPAFYKPSSLNYFISCRLRFGGFLLTAVRFSINATFCKLKR